MSSSSPGASYFPSGRRFHRRPHPGAAGDHTVPSERAWAGRAAVALLVALSAAVLPRGLLGQCEALAGEVIAGERWEQAFGAGLVFRLEPVSHAPPNPPGWTIQVRAEPDGEHNLVSVATPPYRGFNPRDLNIGYGRSPRRVVAWKIREFRFATGERARRQIREAVQLLLWKPTEMSETEYETVYDSVRSRWQAMIDRAGRGRLRITDAEVSGPGPEQPDGRIERLAFQVTLCPDGSEPTRDATAPTRPRDPSPPGRRVAAGTGPVPVAAIEAACLELAWPGERAALSDSLASSTCRVAEAGRLTRTGGTEWRFALYHRRLVYVATENTPEATLALLPDTLEEHEVVLFAGSAGADRVAPVWHDRTDARLELLRRPRTVEPDSATALLLHRRCLSGTGGCRDHPLLLEPEGGVADLEPGYLEALRAELPQDWGTWKGVHVESWGPVARAPVYLPGDANCCASFEARMPLRVVGGKVVAKAVSLTPDTTHRAWRIEPGEERFGPLTGGMSEEELRRRVGSSQVERSDVYLAEGFCTVGARVFPDTRWGFEVAWSDSSRSRPAFARVTSNRPPPGEGDRSPFRTPGGIGPGTPLERLEALAGEPVRFSGFGWDYGGGLAWTAEGGELFLRLDYDRQRLQALYSAGDTTRVEELFGERTVTSDHPLARRLDVRVVSMRLDWRPAGVDRSCG